jgi:cytochrome c2
MKKNLLVICLLAAIVFACNQSDTSVNSLLNTGKLPTQTFVIDISKDTVLTTKKGALIRIPKGALTADDNIARLEVKEAYSMRDIVKAGLTTMSNGQPLSSGGMIYINAVGENNVRITQKIFVATPTPFLEKNMQLFKGEVKGDSTINWTDPKPMPENPQLTALNKGNMMFQENCASCHSITKDLTGPALGGVLERTGRSRHDLDHLYAFTRNPANIMKYSSYYRCLKSKFGGAMMTSFPSLSDEDLDNIYGYIENETKRLNLIKIDNVQASCYDSCRLYSEVAGKWKEIKERLEKESTPLTLDIRNPAADTTPVDTSLFQIEEILPVTDAPTEKDLEYVNPVENKSLYYQFTIESFGWFNIDILLKGISGTVPAELMARIQGQYKQQFDLFLVIPSIKLLATGGPIKDKKDVYGFYMADGSIPLPQQVKAYIIALGEYEDKIIFAKKEFVTQEKQSFDLELTAITQKAFQQQIASMQLSEISFKVDENKKAAEYRKAVIESKKAEELKPKNCDCDCLNVFSYADSNMVEDYISAK